MELVPAIFQLFTSSPFKADTSLRWTVGAGPEHVCLGGTCLHQRPIRMKLSAWSISPLSSFATWFSSCDLPFLLFSISFPHLCKQHLPPQSRSNLHFLLMPYCPSVILRVPVFGLATFWPRTSHQSRSVWEIIRKWFPMNWHLLVLQHYCYYWCLLHMSVRSGLLLWSGRVGKMPLTWLPRLAPGFQAVGIYRQSLV